MTRPSGWCAIAPSKGGTCYAKEQQKVTEIKVTIRGVDEDAWEQVRAINRNWTVNRTFIMKDVPPTNKYERILQTLLLTRGQTVGTCGPSI